MDCTTDLPKSTVAILSVKPTRGGGLNIWLIKAARSLRFAGYNERDIVDTLRCLTATDSIKSNEIERAAKRSGEPIAAGGTASRPAAKWLPVNKAQRAKIITEHDGGEGELFERSPYRFDDAEPLTEATIDALFPHNQLICVGMSQYEFATAPREEFRGKLSERQLIVPSAMNKPTGITQEGKESAHCNDNTGPRQFIVVEQDKGSSDEQAGILMHLATLAPLVMALRSGGKSLHGWFDCREQPNEIVLRFFRHAVTLGADDALWTPCQFCRMPDGLRREPDGTTARQSVLYWNPRIMEASE